MLGVVADVEVPLDQAGHPGGGPQLVVPPVGLRPLRQQRLQLSGGRRRTGRVSGRGGGLASTPPGCRAARTQRATVL